MFCYLEVLKPISRTLLNVFRYSKVLVSILKPKTQPIAENNLPTNFYQPYLFHISDFSAIRYNGLLYTFTVCFTALLNGLSFWYRPIQIVLGKRLSLGLLTKQNSHPKFANSVVIFIKLTLFLYISIKHN